MEMIHHNPIIHVNRKVATRFSYFLSVFFIILCIFNSFVIQSYAKSTFNELKLSGIESKMYSGYLNESGVNLYLYYVYVVKENAPLVIYFNGGPGCSSLIAFLTGVGPALFTEMSDFVKNPNGWHESASLLFLDNPTGSGYSFGIENVTTSLEATKIVDTLLSTEFKNRFPNAFDEGVYPFGESFGARYAVQLANKDMSMKEYIKGVGLVSPWVSPVMQQSVLSQLAYSIGLINYEAMLNANAHGSICNTYIRHGEYEKADEDCLKEMKAILEFGGQFNQYDMRLIGDGDYPFLQDMEIYFNDDSNAIQFNARHKARADKKFHICSKDIRDKFKADFHTSILDTIADLLNDSKIKLLVISGQYDFRSSVEGTNEWLRILPWKYRATWNGLLQNILELQDTKGIFKEFENLQHVVVYNAGHLVSMDQGEVVKYLVTNFVNDKNLCTVQKCNQVQCPNQCSTRGECNSSNRKCECYIGYSGDDCSVYESSLTFGTKKKFVGRLFGKDYDIYKLDIGEFGRNHFDIRILVTKLPVKDGGLKLGKLEVFLSGGKSYVQPNMEKLFQDQFEYSSTEDIENTLLIVNELDRESNTHLTLVIANHIDTESHYSLEITTLVSGRKPDRYQLAIFMTIITLAIGVIGLCLLGTAQWLYSEKKLRRKPTRYAM